MEFHVEPGFVHSAMEPRFFVRSLKPNDDGWKCGYRWQIQLLNDCDEGAAYIDFGPDDGTEFTRWLGVDVPAAVVEAAMRGINDYVDSEGRRRQPSFLGGGQVE